MWQLPLLLSCPDHGCLLETCMGFPSGGYFEWTGGNTFPCRADKQIRTMDRLTAQALTTGRVRLPRRSMHAGIWFRLLRTLVDELNTPISRWGSHAPDLRLAWEARGLPIRAGQSKWRPFEYCPWPVQTHLLEAAAGAIALLEAGSITGGGTHAGLFRSVRRSPGGKAEWSSPSSENARAGHGGGDPSCQGRPCRGKGALRLRPDRMPGRKFRDQAESRLRRTRH